VETEIGQRGTSPSVGWHPDFPIVIKPGEWEAGRNLGRGGKKIGAGEEQPRASWDKKRRVGVRGQTKMGSWLTSAESTFLAVR